MNFTVRMISIVVVLIGAAWWLVYAIFFGKDVHIALRVTAALVGLLAIIVAFDRDLYLPFLGQTVVPSPLIIAPVQQKKSPSNPQDVSVTITGLPPLTKVMYWAAEGGDPRNVTTNMPKPSVAYNDFHNSGVVESNSTGIAEVVLVCPQRYKVPPFNKVLPRHLHYRYVLTDRPGMLSKVFTLKFECNPTQQTSTSTTVVNQQM